MRSGTISVLIFILILVTHSAVAGQKERKGLTGQWVYNEIRTAQLQPKLRQIKKGRNLVGVGIGGVLVPLPSSTNSRQSDASLRIPVILNCGKINIQKKQDRIHMDCDPDGSRDFLFNPKHGRKVWLSERKLRESYSSTSRRVSHEFEVMKDSVLKVTVIIKVFRGAKTKYIRIYDRIAEATPDSQALDNLHSPKTS